MLRNVTLIAALLMTSAGYAQSTAGLEIGYVKGSAKGDAIYLINSDGTGETKLYQAPRQGRFGGQIDRLSLRPGGGEVAFVLNGTQLMIQLHETSGQPNGDAFEIDLAGACGLYDPDYRSDGDLYIADTCLNVWVVDTDARLATSVLTSANVSALAAIGTSLLYVEAGSVVNNGDLKLRTASGTITTVTQLSYTLPLHLDAVGNVGVLSGSASYRTVNLTNGGLATGCTSGGMVKYSPTGTQMVYEFRNTLLILNSDCSGAPFRLARGAKAVAWRSN
jgi:hypothetical protein